MIGRVAMTIMRPFVPAIGARQLERAPELGPRSPRDAFFDLVEATASRDRLPFHLAMAEVRDRHPRECQAAFPASRRSSRH